MIATKQQLEAALAAIRAIADAIREAGAIPAGTLYAACMSSMDMATFDSFVDRLIGAGLVQRDNSHLLTWIDPK